MGWLFNPLVSSCDDHFNAIHGCLEWRRYHGQRLVRNSVFVGECGADPTLIPGALDAVDDLAALKFVRPLYAYMVLNKAIRSGSVGSAAAAWAADP